MSTSRKPTIEEAEAILTLVRGGWLRLELSLDEPTGTIVDRRPHSPACSITHAHHSPECAPDCPTCYPTTPEATS